MYSFKPLHLLSSESARTVTNNSCNCSSSFHSQPARWPRRRLASEISTHLSLPSSSSSPSLALVPSAHKISRPVSLSPQQFACHFLLSSTVPVFLSSGVSALRFSHSGQSLLLNSLTEFTHSQSPQWNTRPGALCLASVCLCVCVWQSGEFVLTGKGKGFMMQQSLSGGLSY